MEISEASGAQSAIDMQQHTILASGEEIFRLWLERVRKEIPAVGDAGKPALAEFLPALYDNIAEAIAPGIERPFGTDSAHCVSDCLWTNEKMTALRTDNVVKELQIFRGVIFAFAKKCPLIRSEDQCELVGHLIDTSMRQAIISCTSADRDMRDNFISELSHELRNPLNVASALAQLIQRRPDNEKVAMMATRIYEKIAETDAMIQSTVDTLGKKSFPPDAA